MSLLFAATYPERARALVLYGCYARHPTQSASILERNIEFIDRAWGTGEFCAKAFFPMQSSDEGLRHTLARFERQSASPSAAIAVVRMARAVSGRVESAGVPNALEK